MDAPSSPQANASPFHTPAKIPDKALDPNESIISPRFLRVDGTPRKQVRKPLDIFEPNCSIIAPDVDKVKVRETMCGSPHKTNSSSLLLSQLNQNQAVVNENFLSCKLNQQTRVVRTESKGRTYYTTVPMISSFSPKSDTQNSQSNRSAVRNLNQEDKTQEKTTMEKKLLAEIEYNRKIIHELRERIMRDKQDACTCINNSILSEEHDGLSDSLREYIEAHPVEEVLMPIVLFALLVYVLHLATEPLFINGSWKYIYLIMLRISYFIRVYILEPLFD